MQAPEPTADGCIRGAPAVLETRWMDAQGEWNARDRLCRVTAEVHQGETLVRLSVPISVNVFRIAMRQCKCKVSAHVDLEV